MKIEVDISRHLQPGDEGTLKALLDEGWRLGLELGPILVLRHRTKIAGEPATALIELNGQTMHAFGWETTLLWGARDDIVGEQRKSLAEAVQDIRSMLRLAHAGDIAQFVPRRFG